MATVQTPAPPDPPELPEATVRAPEWPAWFAPLGFVVGLFGTFLTVAVVGGIATAATGAGTDSPGYVVIGTVFQGLAFGAAAVYFASRVAPPKLWHFGLRPSKLGSTVGWALLGIFGFYVLSVIYGVLVHTDAKQDTVDQLGGDNGGFGLAVAGAMVIMVAPVVEEFFFRGFFYRALRSKLSWAAAALVDGVLFGSIHYSGHGWDGVLILPPLMLLGVLFCLVYERTGTLLAPIGMHAFNNTIAFAAQADDGWKVSVVAGPLMLILLLVAAKLLPPGPARAGPGAGRVARA